MLRKCPVRSCRHRMADRMFVCEDCWRSLPHDYKRRMVDAINDYRADLIGYAELKRIGAEVLSGWQRLPLSEVEGGEFTSVYTILCRRCAIPVLQANRPDGSGKITLEPHALGPLVVIGCAAIPAGTRGHQYTRFVEHACSARATA